MRSASGGTAKNGERGITVSMLGSVVAERSTVRHRMMPILDDSSWSSGSGGVASPTMWCGRDLGTSRHHLMTPHVHLPSSPKEVVSARRALRELRVATC